MIRSAIGRTPTTPGPLTPVMRPRRKTTMRVYSGTTRKGRKVPCILAGPLIAVPPCDSIGIRFAVHLRDGRDHEGETLGSPDRDFGSDGGGRRRIVAERRSPVLAAYAHRARRVERLGADRGFAEERLGAAHDRYSLRPPRGARDDEEG